MQDYLNDFSDVVESYEDQRYPIARVSGLDALRHLVVLIDKTWATVAAEASVRASPSYGSTLGPSPAPSIPDRISPPPPVPRAVRPEMRH